MVMKYWVIKFGERHGEFEGQEIALKEAKEKPKEFDMVAWMYGVTEDDEDPSDEGIYWWGNESMVCVTSIYEIPKEHYNILRKYI